MNKHEMQKRSYLARNERKLNEVCSTIAQELKVCEKAVNKAISMFILFLYTNYHLKQLNN